MAEVEARNLSIRYGEFTALEKLDLTVPHGQFLVLLGPSGCGKSTLLNSIAGLQPITSGQIWIGGKNVTWAEPKDRGIAMVFQSYALYPKMTVRQNLSFGLKVAGVKAAEIAQRVQRAAETLQLHTMLDRRPAELSGGQRQRVAIGRVLVREAEVYLYDEPLSNLDAQLRVELRREIKRLHRHLGSTSIYVTHDQVEALTLADMIAVMNKGRIEQLGSPEEIYERPATRYVAAFIGSPAMNFIDGDIAIEAGKPVFKWGQASIPLDRYGFAAEARPGKATLGVRPEHIAHGEHAGGQDFLVETTIDLLEPMGSDTLVWCRTKEGQQIGLRVPTELRPREGDAMPLGISVSSASLFDTASGLRL